MDKTTKKLKVLSFKKDTSELNKILNEWDFLNVAQHGILNEYMDLINPILNALYNKANADELAITINTLLADRYGLKSHNADKAEVAQKIINWWSNKK